MDMVSFAKSVVMGPPPAQPQPVECPQCGGELDDRGWCVANCDKTLTIDEEAA
jgi:hypothetical protein